jgi:hypothetical protein
MTDSGASGDRMVRASAQGNQAVQRGRSELNAEKRAGIEQGERTAGRVGSLMSQHAGRQQQADQFQSSQQQQADQFQSSQQESGRRFDAQQQSQNERTDLDAAKSGFERGGARGAQLEQEMQRGGQQMAGGPGAQGATGGRGPGELNSEDQARLQGQVSKPLEDDGGWRPTQERKDAQAAEQQKGAFQADTNRMNAETARYNAEVRADEKGAAYQKAAMAGQKEEQAAMAADLARPINQNVAKFDRFQNGDVNEQDWGDLSKLAGESNEMDPSLQADIDAKSYTPRVQQFMRAQISRESLKFIVRTGSTGDIADIDWTAPQMQAFTDQVAQVNAMAKTMGPDFAAMAGIKSVADKMAFVRTQAAMMVLSGMDQYSQPDPSQGMPPSMGQQPEPRGPQQQGIDPRQVRSPG